MRSFALAAVLAVSALAQEPSKPSKPAVAEFTSINIEVKDPDHKTVYKIWTPANFVVHKGDKVRIKLVNTAASGVHGFAIEGYNVATEVNNKPGDNSKTVEFTADKAGVFKIYCQIHAAHVGGQLLVLD